jgi:hypothetical protein
VIITGEIVRDGQIITEAEFAAVPSSGHLVRIGDTVQVICGIEWDIRQECSVILDRTAIMQVHVGMAYDDDGRVDPGQCDCINCQQLP